MVWLIILAQREGETRRQRLTRLSRQERLTEVINDNW